VTISSNTVREFVDRYFEATRSNDAQRWASCFSPNAIVDDPVGSLTLTSPEAILAQGRAFVAAFETVGLEAEFLHTIGYEAVAYWIGRGVTKEGRRVRFEGINLFKFDEDGLILNLKMKQLLKLSFGFTRKNNKYLCQNLKTD
jgi:hypothetical protein